MASKREIRFVLIASHSESILNFRRNLIVDLQKHSVNINVLIPKSYNVEDKVIRNKIEKIGVTVHEIRLNRTSLNPITNLISFVDIFIKLWRIRPTHVLSYTIKPVIYGTLAAKFLKIKHRFALITGLGMTFNDDVGIKNKIIFFFVKRFYRLSLKNSKKVFFQNPDDMKLFQDYRIVNQSQSLLVNGSGVDLDYYYCSDIPNKLSFLLMARLLNSKGVRYYFEAAKNIKSLNPDIEFAIAGKIDILNKDSISIDDIKSWVECGVINYYGHLSDVRKAIERCSVFVLPSFYREGIPRSILEAMSMGRAIITTNTPGCKETVIHGKNGYLIAPKSICELESAITKFINQPSIARKMGIESRVMAKEKFDVHKVNSILLDAMDITR